MIWQTSQLLLGKPPSLRLAGFAFFSTMCSYNFHWFLTPRSASPSHRVQWTLRHKPLHFVLYLAGAVGAGIYFLYLHDYIPALFLGALLTFLYSAPKLPQTIFRSLKKIAVGKTLFLAFVWVYVTAVLPLLIPASAWRPDFVLFILQRFFLIYAICLLFDYRDREDDKAEQIRSLITYLNEKGIDRVFAISLILFGACTLALHLYHYTWLSIAALLLPGIILACLYTRAKRDFSDSLYYIVLDGLMMLSGLIMLIARI
jgi:1,4-dihydroxy-2-naphthoate octaprenyltransferase